MKGAPLLSHLLATIRRKRIWQALEELEAWKADGQTLLQELQSRSVPESALSAECGRLIELLNG